MKSKGPLVLILCCIGFFLFSLGFFVGRLTGGTVIYEKSINMETTMETTMQAQTEVQQNPVEATGTEQTEKTQDSNEKININTADEIKLQQLNGIGPTLAQRIVTYRQTYGPFKTIDQIKDVQGIGDGIFKKIQDMITVG